MAESTTHFLKKSLVYCKGLSQNEEFHETNKFKQKNPLNLSDALLAVLEKNQKT